MKARVVIFLTVSVLLLLAYYKEKMVIHASSPLYQVYEVTINGTVDNRPFTRGGALFIKSTDIEDMEGDGLNKVNFWLVSGKPSGAAGTGAIWLATSGIFYGLPESAEYAAVWAQSEAIDAHFGIEGTPNKNAFSISANQRENVVHLVEGQASFTLQLDGQIEGIVHMVGFNSSSQMPLAYTATISGTYIHDVLSD
jgi:hypothetical protein